MKIAKTRLHVFFLPGNLVLQGLGISVEQDQGILRSFVNSCFWGFITLIIALNWAVQEGRLLGNGCPGLANQPP